MGNTQSMKKINYEDMQTVIKNPEASVIAVLGLLLYIALFVFIK